MHFKEIIIDLASDNLKVCPGVEYNELVIEKNPYCDNVALEKGKALVEHFGDRIVKRSRRCLFLVTSTNDSILEDILLCSNCLKDCQPPSTIPVLDRTKINIKGESVESNPFRGLDAIKSNSKITVTKSEGTTSRLLATKAEEILDCNFVENNSTRKTNNKYCLQTSRETAKNKKNGIKVLFGLDDNESDCLQSDQGIDARPREPRERPLFHCKVCLLTYRSANKVRECMNKHRLAFSLDEPGGRCPICRHDIPSRLQVTDHFYARHPGKMACMVCMNLVTPSQLHKHIQSKHNLTTECKVCLKVLSSDMHFWHFKLHLSRMSNMEDLIGCPECKSSMKRIELTGHFKTGVHGADQVWPLTHFLSLLFVNH